MAVGKYSAKYPVLPSRAMKRSDFYYSLPEELIANFPCEQRTASRMLLLDGRTGTLQDKHFQNLIDLLNPGDLLIFNDTRVIPARLFCQKSSGGKVEILVERVTESGEFVAQARSSKPLRPGTQLLIDDEPVLEVKGREGDLFRFGVLGALDVAHLLDRFGHVPLPPYIKRIDVAEDIARYQTVYARRPGAVAAPTAGLHFDETMMRRLEEQGIRQAFVTLHVGAGTFQPVRVEDLDKHHMHKEICEVTDKTCQLIDETRAQGGQVVAVGTTVARTLESACRAGELGPYHGETDLFITPGYQFRVIDVLLTNFHLPESTLLMLVCAFAGYENTLAAYRHAIADKYRFFSYGDAMFIQKR